MFLYSLAQSHSLSTVLVTLASAVSPYSPQLPVQTAAELNLSPQMQQSITIPIPVPRPLRRATQQQPIQQGPQQNASPQNSSLQNSSQFAPLLQTPIQQGPTQSALPRVTNPFRFNLPNQSEPAQPPAIAPQVVFLRQAIIGQESGANFRAVNPHSGALGYGQIMPFNLPSWSREALGHEVDQDDFLNSPETQIAIIDHKLNQYWQQSIAASDGDEAVAVMRVAAWWYCGKPDRYSSTTPQYYGGHPYPSIASYSRSVLQRYQNFLAQAAQPATLTQYSSQNTGRY